MTNNKVLVLFLVHEKHEKHEKHERVTKGCAVRGWTGFVTPSKTFQNTYRYLKHYGTGNKPVPAFVLGRIATKQPEQAS
jgi:hypothetical protein